MMLIIKNLNLFFEFFIYQDKTLRTFALKKLDFKFVSNVKILQVCLKLNLVFLSVNSY